MRAWDYPYQTVVVRCDQCGREGRYPKARFVALVGAHTALPDALRIIAKDCPKAGQPLTAIHDRCGAYYPELKERSNRPAPPAGGANWGR